jgi:hypothetical protein
MREDYIQYKLVNKKSKEEIKIDEMYYDADTTALQIKIAILKYYNVDGVNPEMIKLRSRHYKNNMQDIGSDVELSTIFRNTNSDKNEITFEINQDFQNAADTLVSPHKVIENKPLRFNKIMGNTFDYIGDIKDRKPNGKGKITYISGDDEGNVYEGEITDGVPDGYGKMTFSSQQNPRIESYQGVFLYGQTVDMLVSSPDSDETRAYIIYRNGDQYEGGVNSYNQPKGFGKMMKQNGEKNIGKFNFGKFISGKVIHPDGRVEEVDFENISVERQRLNARLNARLLKPNTTNDDENNSPLTNIASSSVFNYDTPPSSPKRGGLFTRKYKKLKKRKTRQNAKKRRTTIRNKAKKSKRGNKSRKYK